MAKLEQEASRRRTFAIISHPDAGKTTLTEKLLLLGGAIRSAGSVKSRKSKKFATSDWMELEKQRGISVTSSVMQFVYDDYKINILDTPGHQDFSEDTYRTLMAVDSVVMIIDAAKGVEAQTLKLFKVCRDRGIPIFTFINKLDRQGKEPLELFEELEEVLGIQTCPVNYPIGMGQSFRGVYDRFKKEIELYDDKREQTLIPADSLETVRERLVQVADEATIDQLEEELLLLEEAGNPFNAEAVKAGKQTLVFFGSAISSFGVPTFLKHFLELAPGPAGRETSKGHVDPADETFSGFIFKIQANMNPAHRDRIAFLRICSGKYEKGMETWLDRTGKPVKLAQPQQFFADSRENVEDAYPGDIVGIYDPGLYQIGDTLCATKDTFNFGKLPTFPPEHFSKVRAKTAMKQKHFIKGIEQLAQEGAVQIYKTERYEEYILGVVGQLQFDVFKYRMEAEYNVDLDIQPMSFHLARWLLNDEIPREALRSTTNMVVHDSQDRPVILFENEFGLNWFMQKNPDIKLAESVI
ncbi:peptide chain release factor 3 [Pullulanibacillus pueri]|uniref:Peptide chain release factor 3 n=1 Tax=Pullulanibacillus pueri TaxID=1437324 RepID=A0A8J2ZYD3_9BACL|nr:peptide chain release factor 3 [Pullulanibacillus pueri]MBM7683571.1 peptide chain release factor 3 [Pullulanibacillus pueri]GGH84471.1 peptide chain release factor 3 [Pullulanibacillus pueri]